MFSVDFVQDLSLKVTSLVEIREKSRILWQLVSWLLNNPQEVGEPVREAMLASMAEAALGGHDLHDWELVEKGCRASCSRCGTTSWIGHDGLRYSLLEDECPGEL